MSTRSDIIDGTQAESATSGLVYTKKAGWIDLGHARPKGARELWEAVLYERDTPFLKNTKPISPSDLKDWFVIRYHQQMTGYKMTFSESRDYAIKRKLPLKTKQSIALAIFMDVSLDFEGMQASWPYTIRTDSGYSVEDLISNLIGFHRAVFPGKKYVDMCEPVSRETSLKLWDTYGAVGSYKNGAFMPVLFPPINEKDNSHGKPYRGALPTFLNVIQPNRSPEVMKQYIYSIGEIRSLR